MSSVSSSLAALCDELQSALSGGNSTQIRSVIQQLEAPTTALIDERTAVLASSPSVEADEAARPVLRTLQLLLQCSQLGDLPHGVVNCLLKALRSICTTASMQRYFTAAPADSHHGQQLLYAIVHHLLTCSTRWIDELSRTVYELLSSPQPTPPAPNQSPILKMLVLCRLYLHPLMLVMRAYPTLFHSQVPQCVLLCNRMLSEVLALPPSNPHRRLSLRDCLTSLNGLVNNSTAVILQSPDLPLTDKCGMLDSIFPAFLAGQTEIGPEHAAALLFSLCQLLQATPLYPADVVESLFRCQLPILMALLPRAHPYTLLRDDLPPPTPSQNPSHQQNGSTQHKSTESAFTPQLGKLLDDCTLAVYTLLTALLEPAEPIPHADLSTTQPTPPTSRHHQAVRSFLWHHLLCPEPPLASRLAAMVLLRGVVHWGGVFRVQVVMVALHVLRSVGGERSLEDMWRLKAVEMASDLLSAIFPLLFESEQQRLWSALGVVDGLTRLAADCDVVVPFDAPPSSRLLSSSQSSSQSLTPTQPLSASPPTSQPQRPTGGSAIPLCLAVRLLHRTHLAALHSSTQVVVGQTAVRLLVAYVQHFSGAERVASVQQLSLLLHTFQLLEWLLASPLALSAMLIPAQQRDLEIKAASTLSSILRVADSSFSHTAKDAIHHHAMTVTTFIERLQECSPMLQQRLLLAVLALLDTSCINELTAAQLVRVLHGVAVIAEQWPSVRWRIPPILLRVCGLPVLRSASAAPDSPSSRPIASSVTLWHTLLQRTPSTSTSVTDVLCFDSAISHLFDSTTRLATTPFKADAATLLPAHNKHDILQQLKLWRTTTHTPHPHTPSDEQWTLLHWQRQSLLAEALAHGEWEAQQQAVGGGWGVEAENGVKMELVAGSDGVSRYVSKVEELTRHNVRSREIARMLLQARSQMSDDEWRQVKATLRDDEAEWVLLFNEISSVS